MTRITEKGVRRYMDRIFEIQETTDNELVEVLCIIASCMLHDLNNVNIKLLTTTADRHERDRENMDSIPAP